jgi:hypothetical protein
MQCTIVLRLPGTLISLIPPHLCACPKTGTGFLKAYIMFFFWLSLIWGWLCYIVHEEGLSCFYCNCQGYDVIYIYIREKAGLVLYSCCQGYDMIYIREKTGLVLSSCCHGCVWIIMVLSERASVGWCPRQLFIKSHRPYSVWQKIQIWCIL